MESFRREDKTPASNRTPKRDGGEQKSYPGKRPSTDKGLREGKSYFDMLSQDAAENIIRFTSDRPRSVKWISYVSAELVLSLLEANSIMASCCRSLFVSLEVSPISRSEFSSLKVWGNSTLQVERLISYLGEALTHLIITASRSFSESWKRCLTPECVKLKRLSIALGPNSIISLSELLSAHYETLEFLEIGNPSTAIDTMWKSMGANLKELWFRGRINLVPLMKNCKNLQKLRFSWLPSDCHQDLEDLCRSLGKQLTFASLGNCNIDSIRLGRIASSCANVSFNVREIGGCTIGALQAMGARACMADIGERTMRDCNNIYKCFQLAGECCENLRSISVSNELSKNLFLALFTNPKPLLVDFKANYDEYHDTHFVFEVLARNTSSIETFDFVGRLPLMSVLKDFVESNPSLKTVQIVDTREEASCYRESFEPLDSSTGYNMGVVANIFLRCTSLKEVDIACRYCMTSTWQEHFAKACLPARCRNVTVRICEYTYFQ